MNAHLKTIFLGGSVLLVAACQTTLPDVGSPAITTSAHSLLSSAEDKTVPITTSANPVTEDTGASETASAETDNTKQANTVAGNAADGDAVTSLRSEQAFNSEFAIDSKPATAIPAKRAEAMPLPADQTQGKEAAPVNDTPAANTADTIDKAFDVAAGTLTPPPTPPEAAPEISEPKPAPPPAEFEPASVVGLSADQLEARFGTADLLRREGTSEVWQYRLSACVVDYFVYPDGAGIRKIVAWDWRAPVLSVDIDALKCRQDLAIRDQETSQG
ncbi:MAG: hypothetical protein CMM73_01255 [Rhodospirillaceae bacterium]|nr:hypothetical protein [Rhodospirillaceae bacterium]